MLVLDDLNQRHSLDGLAFSYGSQVIQQLHIASRWLIEKMRKVFLNPTYRKPSSPGESPAIVTISEKGILLLLCGLPRTSDSIPGENRGILKDNWDPS